MSKGLEALHRIANAKNHFKYDTLELVDKDFQIVQQELQRLESIDNASPSEFKIVNYKGQYYLQINVNDDETTQIQLPLLEDEIKDVQLAIDKFKQINQANPSEALECLDKIVDKGRINDGSCCHWRECLSKNKCNFNNDNLMCPDYTRANTIKQALINFDLTRDFLKDLSKLTNETNLNKIMKKLQEQEKVLEIIKEYQVDIWLLKQCDYANYIRIRKEAMVSVGQIVNENGTTLEDEITEEYFDLVKRC